MSLEDLLDMPSFQGPPRCLANSLGVPIGPSGLFRPQKISLGLALQSCVDIKKLPREGGLVPRRVAPGSIGNSLDSFDRLNELRQQILILLPLLLGLFLLYVFISQL